MFSWIDYFKNENDESVDEKHDITILKKSDLCQKINGCRFTSRGCDEKRRIGQQKKNSKKSNVSDHATLDSRQKCDNMKQRSKILDLSPEEKEKIAALIRELGVLQAEKERVSHELFEERNKFQLELTTMEKMYRTTLNDKDRLEEELQKKNEAFKNLEMEERKKARKERQSVVCNQQFTVIPKTAETRIDQCGYDSIKKGACFLGPPKSSRSERLKTDLLRTHSSQSVDRTSETDRNSLMEEQRNLVFEKQYLGLVLKQQKCLKKLTSKISKLEHNSRQQNAPIGPFVNSSETSSIITNSIDLVTPRTLNNLSLDEDSLSQSVSLSTVSHLPTFKTSNSPTAPIVHIDAPSLHSSVLKTDDLLLITALNEGIKNVHHNLTSSPKPYPSLTSTRTHSPSDSLFQIIDTLDEIQFPNRGDTEFDRASFRASCDDDILNDLFFNI